MHCTRKLFFAAVWVLACFVLLPVPDKVPHNLEEVVCHSVYMYTEANRMQDSWISITGWRNSAYFQALLYVIGPCFDENDIREARGMHVDVVHVYPLGTTGNKYLREMYSSRFVKQ